MAACLTGIDFWSQGTAEGGGINVGTFGLEVVAFRIGRDGVVISAAIADGEEDVVVADIVKEEPDLGGGAACYCRGHEGGGAEAVDFLSPGRFFECWWEVAIDDCGELIFGWKGRVEFAEGLECGVGFIF